MTTYHMADIISLLGLPYPPQGRSSYYIPCPCCDSGRKKHLNINLAKDVFRCPRCGFSGGLFDLYAHYTGISRDDVYEELKKRLGGFDDDISPSVKKKTNTRPAAPVPEITDCPVTDIDTRDATYRALLGKLSLATDHKQNLLGRGLPDEVIIRNGYKTTPAVGTKALAKQLLADGCYLAGVPGFYRDQKDQQWTFVQNKRGILVPVQDYRGRIQGLQIRRDEVKKRKFRWVSSAERLDGCRAEGWVHIAGPVREQVLLTEGPMKGDIIHHLTGQTVVAVPGVNTLTQLEMVLTKLMDLGIKHIMTAFDMDFMMNHHVQNGYFDLIWMLNRIGLKFGTYLWHPEYNGLDDYVWECLMNELLSA